MLRSVTIPALLALAIATSAMAASNANTDAAPAAPSFYEHVLPVLQQNCQTCHRPSGLNLGGMVAPMALVTYDETRPWAKSIARVVEAGEMPPWHASAEYDGVFSNERKLSDSEKATLVNWARSGAIAGDPAKGPAPILWPSSPWALGEPDLILSLPEAFLVGDDVEDLNINIPLDITVEMLPEDKYVVGIEYKPGSKVVHHIIGFTVVSGRSGVPGGMQMVGGIAPGSEPNFFPEGYGLKLFAGSRFIFQMHYHKEPGPGTATYDQSQVAFKFADKPVQPLHILAVGDPSKMYVPANSTNEIVSTRTFDKPITVIALLPHMHLRGSSATYVAVLPDGTRKSFLEVPRYDFNWQTGYKFEDHLELPAGTTVEVTMGYDNTANNPHNPNPGIDVKWGDATTDEMNLGWMTWAYTNPEDEDGSLQMPIGFGGGGGRRGGQGR
jgi:mono/diheme cytochrome c family protein